ncbi:MAG: SDR family oxidoreductase [Nitrosospira sp.]
MQSVKTYFITGATGAIGTALVPILLEDKNARIKLLMRAKSTTELNARLETLYQFWKIGLEDSNFRERIQAIRGDVASPHFELDELTYRGLCADCTHIIHSAGNVRMNLPLEQARRSAVGSAQNVVEFSRDCTRLEKIEFVSTVGVGGHLALVPETWLSKPRAFHNTYEQSKAEAEDYIRSEVEQGLPLTVHRPSMVVGDSRTGKIIHFQIFYYLCEFLSGRRTWGILPQLGGVQLDIIPVNVVAGAIAWSSRRIDTAGQILHLCSGPEKSVKLLKLRELVRIAFVRSRLDVPAAIFDVPPRLFSALLSMSARLSGVKMKRQILALPIFLDYLATRQTFQNVRTQKLLEVATINIPDPQVYVEQVLDCYLDRKYGS